MLNVKNSSVMNLENALRGARNPMNSWDKSDSRWCSDPTGKCMASFVYRWISQCVAVSKKPNYVIGPIDLELAKKLCNAGSDHRKFIRQIFVSVDITAPLYWWKEYDTYKVGTVANSTSTMHKIHSKQFTMDDFSCDQLSTPALAQLEALVGFLEATRQEFNRTNDKQFWWDLIQLLPTSYNQMRTCTLDYEVLRNIYHARHTHKLDEWHILCDWIKTLPYADILIIGDERDTDE